MPNFQRLAPRLCLPRGPLAGDARARSASLPWVLALALALLVGGHAHPLGGAEGAATEGTPMVDEGYQLFPGDVLEFRVFDHPDLALDLRVPATGSTTMPLIGDIGRLAGRPLVAVQAEITQRLAAEYLVDPVVTLMVSEYGPRQAVVMGAVEDSAAVPLNPLLPTTAIQAVGKAGGFAEDADRVRTVVLRRAENGQMQALPVAASDEAVDISSDQILQHGDLVIVPRLDRIYVIGQVSNPGAVTLPNQERLTVSKAISLRGGFDRFARQGSVLLIREGQNMTVDVGNVLSGRGGEDPVLRPGDTVYVPASRF